MTLGPRASSSIDRAVALEPENPRIVLQQGVSAFHTPGMFGGGADKAERLLRRCVELFAREPRDKAWPNWGRADAHAWLGQVRAKRGDRGAARAEYERALAIAPEFGWVRYVLLPALDKKK
jgi:Flp pilus assembly protein TadD